MLQSVSARKGTVGIFMVDDDVIVKSAPITAGEAHDAAAWADCSVASVAGSASGEVFF